MSSNTLSFDPGMGDLSALWEAWADDELDHEFLIQNALFEGEDQYQIDELDVIVQEAHAYFRDIEEAEIRHSEDMIERGLR